MKKTSTQQAIKRIATIAVAIVAMWLLPKGGSAQTTYYFYNGTGAPDAVTSWGTNPDGTGTNPANFTTSGCRYYFSGANGKTVTLPTTFGVTGKAVKGGAIASIVVDTLGVNVIVPTGGLAKATTFGVSDSSWLTLQDTLNVKLTTMRPTSTVTYDGAATLNFLAGTYGNLVSKNDAGATRIIPNKRTISVYSTFDPGKSTYLDSGTIRYYATATLGSVQHLTPFTYNNLTITNPNGVYLDSGVVTVLGKLTVSKGDSLIIDSAGTIVLASTTAPTLTGVFHVWGTVQITANLASIPGNANTMYDTTSNVVIGDGTNSVTVLPKLTSLVTPFNVVINAPAVASHSAGLLYDTIGAYTIGNDLIIQAGKVNGSGSIGTGNNSLTVGGDLDINGGSYTVCDSTASNDTLITQGALNIMPGGAFYFSDNSQNKTLTGMGTLMAYSDIVDSSHESLSFGTATGSTVGGKIYFLCPDTAGQVIAVPEMNNNVNGPVEFHAASGNEVEIFSNITMNAPVYCDTGSYTVDAGFHMTVNKGFANYYKHSFVITDALVGQPGQGLLTVNNIPKDAWYTIPLGYDSASAYTPMAVKSADDNISVTVTNYEMLSDIGSVDGNAPTDTMEINNVVLSTWNFTRNDAGTSPILFKIGWYDSVAQAGFNADKNNADFTVYAIINNGTAFSEYPPISVDRANDSVVIELPGTFKTGYFMIGKKGIKVLLPIHFTNVAAELKSQFINLNWKTTTDQNISSYTVERSSDGIHYSVAGTVSANNKAMNAYSFNDAHYATGENYYRIKANDKSGSATYSSVVKVSVSATVNKSISIYPNPVVGKVISIGLTNQNADVYTAELVSNNGQILATKKINHAGGSSVNTFDVSSQNVRGVYFLKITSSEGQTTKTVFIK